MVDQCVHWDFTPCMEYFQPMINLLKSPISIEIHVMQLYSDMCYLYLEAPICSSSNFMCIQEAGLENITVIIFVSQGLVQQPVDEIIQTGENVTLTCLCNSFPSAGYSWERNLIDTDEFETIENESYEQFIIDLVDYEDFGIYQCVIHTSLVNTIINGSVPTFNVVIIGRLSRISNIMDHY